MNEYSIETYDLTTAAGQEQYWAWLVWWALGQETKEQKEKRKKLFEAELASRQGIHQQMLRHVSKKAKSRLSTKSKA